VVALHGYIKHQPERPQIGGGVALLTAEPFRRNVIQRADHTAGGGESVQPVDRRDTEVGQHRRAVLTHDHIRGLDIAV
jgi:hypothetical protein